MMQKLMAVLDTAALLGKGPAMKDFIPEGDSLHELKTGPDPERYSTHYNIPTYCNDISTFCNGSSGTNSEDVSYLPVCHCYRHYYYIAITCYICMTTYPFLVPHLSADMDFFVHSSSPTTFPTSRPETSVSFHGEHTTTAAYCPRWDPSPRTPAFDCTGDLAAYYCVLLF